MCHSDIYIYVYSQNACSTNELCNENIRMGPFIQKIAKRKETYNFQLQNNNFNTLDFHKENPFQLEKYNVEIELQF